MDEHQAVAAGGPQASPFEAKIRLRGFARAVGYDSITGEVVCERRTANLVVAGGRAEILKLIATGGGGNRISHAGVGTSNQAPATNDPGLIAATENRQAVTASLNGGTVDFSFSFASTDVNTTLQEVALFASSSSGTLFARATHSQIVKSTAMTLAYTYQLQLQTGP